MSDEERKREIQQFWDGEAAAFDDQPDHGLRDPAVRAAWTDLLRAWLPARDMDVLDAGCGTGSLSVVMAGLGQRVTGIDLSPAMVAKAEAKAAASAPDAGRPIEFQVMDAAAPQFPPGRFDAMVCRHLLWALPNLPQVLRRWAELLRPGGRLVMVEGFWHTGSGLHAQEIVDALPPAFPQVTIQPLSDRDKLWGARVADERYAIIAIKE